MLIQRCSISKTASSISLTFVMNDRKKIIFKFFSWEKKMFFVDSELENKKKIDWRHLRLMLQWIKIWFMSWNITTLIVYQLKIFVIPQSHIEIRIEFNFWFHLHSAHALNFTIKCMNESFSPCSVRRLWQLIKMNFTTFMQIFLYFLCTPLS